MLGDFQGLSFNTAPEAAGEHPRGSAAMPSDSDYSGEQDLATWIAELGEPYETCR